MNFKIVSFYKSIWLWTKEIFFNEKKEIVFVGRSNVGKSSLLNALFDKKNLVKTSSKPWKTKLANLFLVENKYYFTDLPWYWFAKVSKQMQTELDSLISWYVEEKKESIKKVVILIDSKLWPREVDIDMYKYLLKLGVWVVIVLSKIDKLSKWELQKSISFTKKHFFWQDVFSVSSTKKININELKKYLKNSLKD